MQALRIAATGMHAQQLNVDVLSNNIANLNTTGFKQSNPAFQDLVYNTIKGVGAITSAAGTIAPTGVQIGYGVGIGSVYKIMEQGTLNNTGNDLDIAVSGRGFLKITMPDGTTSYTRDGSLSVNADGDVVTKEGYSIDPAINIPTGATDITITGTGIVSAKVDNTVTELGTITLSMFVNEAGLENIGDNKYLETIASGTPADVNPGESGSGTITQGFLEASNVDAIESITRLITAQRAYELNSRVISTADEMLSTLSQIS
ncbi:MAG: flagellar basal-body rod protein FlgG [Alphaproteobacteria bacterium CG_4_10_14_0_8_um_filter_53_9]|nr:MAG: flagellar basal-body rod protein FlgG [Alphaproteobacteria bacterium CG_4_10_14_0_8_um_filter_53_9]